MATDSSRTVWWTAQAAVAPAVWGSTYLVTTELLPPGRPVLAGALRALPAGLLLLAITRNLPTGSWWWRALVLGTLNIGAFFALLFLAAYRLPGGVAAALGAVGPLAVAGLAVPLLGQCLTPRRVIAGVGAVVGVGLLVLRAEATLDPVGVAAGLAATASMALGVVLTQRWGRPVPLLAFTGWQLTAGGLVLAPLALAVEGVPATLSPANLAGYAYLSLVRRALAYALWFRGIAQLSAPAVSFLSPLSPLVAALLGAAVLGQTLTTWQALGFTLALASLLAGQLPDQHRPHRTRAVTADPVTTPGGAHPPNAGDGNAMTRLIAGLSAYHATQLHLPTATGRQRRWAAGPAAADQLVSTSRPQVADQPRVHHRQPAAALTPPHASALVPPRLRRDQPARGGL